MNSTKELIESIFANFTVDNVSIPVCLLRYKGHGEPYVVWMQEDADASFSGDDNMLGYVDFYDFDVYATGNYERIVESVKQKLIANGFMWQASRSSSDMFEPDTGYYHKTLSFAIHREV